MKKILVVFFHLAVMITCYGQVKFYKGLRFDQDEYQKVPKKASLTRGDYDKIPEQYSLVQFSPYAGNQIQLNTSASWAAAYAAKTILNAEASNLTDRAEITRRAFSPVFNYALSTNMDNKGCKIETTLTGVLQSLKNFGVPRYIDFQEFCPRSVSPAVYASALPNKITDYVRLFDLNDAPEFKIQSVKKSLAEGMPVVIGMVCPPSFYIATEFWQPREKVSDKYTGHALCVVGFDNAKYGGSFEVMNSWGRKWGNNGNIWIRYPDFVEFTRMAYEMFIIEQEANKVDFSGEIQLVRADGKIIDTRLTNNQGYYQTVEEYKSGTNFRIYISNHQTAYIYVFGTDKTNEYFPLFPSGDDVSPILDSKASSVALPNETQHIQITGDPGRDYLVILYSKEEIQMKELMAKMKNIGGRVDERLQSILADDIVENKNVQWEDNSIKFSGIGNGKMLIPVFIEVQHN
jgi:hypothetical protein